MTVEQFIARWEASGDAERANKDLFLSELCTVLGVEQPHPKTGDPAKDLYVFEKNVEQAKAGGRTTTFGDLYKHGCFVLEAKQSSSTGSKKRDSPAWNQMMSEAHGQGLGYATHLETPPLFLLICDIGYCIDVYASFDGTGHYRAFPDGLRKRVFLRELATQPDRVELLQAIWTDPQSLDPSKRSAKVTRDIAEQIANLAKALEADGNDPETVATFLMRCLFTMFAEDVGLLTPRLFTESLENYWLGNPPAFPAGVASLWKAMDVGGNYVTGKLLRFNGGLFASQDAPKLTKEQLILLLLAARSDWSQVDPSIFGTLLERALNPKERHRLGAHYTPRAYVERLVKPTIEEPLRADWDLVRAMVRQLVDDGKVEAAQKAVLEFHHTLCRTRVLDPACGTGNFLYVTLDLFKRLETEVLALLAELGYQQIGLEMATYRVTPEQFLGIEVKRWAKEIAELVLWIGYLQWQVRQPGGALTVPEPVLRDYGNIECRDAVLAYDSEELLRDEHGVPVTRWDGETRKKSPVTGEEIPDESARVPTYVYLNPKGAEWPNAEFIVGNPPFLGKLKMLAARGVGYADALREVYAGEVPDSADYVMYWWAKGAAAVASGRVRRSGFVTTNSISQTFNRRIVQAALDDGCRIVFALTDHPWVDDGAAVRVAMTVMAHNGPNRVLIAHEVVGQRNNEDVLVVEQTADLINADLTVGTDVTLAGPLESNQGLAHVGVGLHASGFSLSEAEANSLRAQISRAGLAGVEKHIRPTRNGRDLTQTVRNTFYIDLYGTEEKDLVTLGPLFQWVVERVKPEREQNPRASRRARWWLFGENAPNMRVAVKGLRSYIATSLSAKHRTFSMIPSEVLADQTLVIIASDDSFLQAVLSSRVHVAWAFRAGGRLGVGNDSRYQKTSCFDPFPFPPMTEGQKPRIRALGEALDSHRKRQQSLHPTLTITGMYNVLEKLRSGEVLTEKDRVIHEQGLVSVLKQIHDDLDAAVFDAYGWPSTLTDEEILERLVALNHERAEEEKRGLIRWLRPDFQNPQGTKAASQSTLVEAGMETPPPAAAAKGTKGAKLAWPKDLPARVVAVRDVLAQAGQASAEDVLARFKGVKAAEAEKVLESLAAVGLAIEATGGPQASRVWRLLR